jgi:hypothetical protein
MLQAKPAAGKINKEWHKQHRMLKNATIAQRIEWHTEHARHCNCRPIPEKLKQEMSRK